ncbi:MAG: NAD(P)/FAD-dependent oxidoreductase [Ignavibacteriae bacterium]|nr:NAD(P)/FAD-dependent oxidoreductase [Ignavibacteriota bacterium]
MTGKTILILGGGIGGIVAARELRKHLAAHHRVILVDKSAIHSFPASFLWVMVGWRKPSAIQKPLALLEKYGIEFHHATVQSIDVDHRTVETDRATVHFDYLIIALGAELAPQNVPGLHECSHSFYTLESAEKLASTLTTFSGGTIAIVVSSIPYKCPPAPYEAAFLLESFFSQKAPGNVEIKIFTPEQAPLSAAGSQASQMLQELLRTRGIAFSTQCNIMSVNPLSRQLTFENGSTASFDLLIAIPPHQAPRVVQTAGLMNESGWIAVDERTLRTSHSNVFALGDVTTIPLVSGFSLPKAGAFAVGQAEVVAHNIATEINYKGISKQFLGTGYCFLETGSGRAGYISGNFYAKPVPEITFHEPSVKYHWAKVVFEKYWLWRWF